MLEFLVGIGLVAYVVWWYLRPRLLGLPPEPTISIPLLGHILAVDWKPETIFKWYKSTGPIFTIRAGHRMTIFVCEIEAIKEVLLNRGDEFAYRPESWLSNALRGGNYGMIDISGEMWQEQRRFSLSVLRHFGIGRPVMEEKIMNETEKLIAQLDFQTNDGKTVLDVESLLKFCIGNIMSSLLFNESFNFGDAKFHCLVETLDKTFELAASTNALLLNSFPFFAKIPINGGFGFAEMIREEQKLREYFKESLKKHRSKQAIITEPDDFIDAYLKEIAIRQKSGDAGYFSEQQLIELIADLWAAGLETTITTLRWAILYMITYPQCQEKIRKELESVVGSIRAPKMSDRPQLPYTCASLLETQRLCNTADGTLAHSTIKDTTLCGFNIPAGTTIQPMIYTVHMDPSIFPEPHVFKPERFLEEDGKLTAKINGFLPFGMGKRVCLGESLAKAEMFLIFTNLIKNFRFSLVEGSDKPSLEPIRSFTLIPQKYTCCVEKCDH